MMPIARAVSAALIQFVWQGALVALLFSILLAALRRRPAQWRYLAGCAALLILALLPIVTAWLLYRPAPLGGIQLPGESGSQLASDWTLPLWTAGVLVVSLRPIWNLAHVYALRRKGSQPETWIVDLASNVAGRMGCARAFGLLISAISGTPAVIGWMRPVILLPAATIAGLSVDQLETVLAHEIAHIRRHDYLINILQVVVETLLFYHPAVWWVSSRIRLERELCCDDEVVHAMGAALCYSRALTILERLRGAELDGAVGSTGGRLAYRIRRLVGDAPSSPEIWPAIPALVLTLALALTCATIGVRWARAQQEPDAVTVEITRDEQFAISSVRIVSGPAYLRPLAMRAAVMAPPMGLQNVSGKIGSPVPPLAPGLVRGPSPQANRVQTITFPAAFENNAISKQQQAIVTSFVDDEVALAERAVQAITGNSAEDQRKLRAAREELALQQRKRSLVRTNEIALELPERQWRVQVASHQVEEFRRQYKGKLPAGTNPALEARYEQMVQALAAAERDLDDLGSR